MIGQFKKDDYLIGALIGIAFPAISAFIIFIILYLSGFENNIISVKIYLLALVINILLVRYYFIALNFEKTARAILFVTFILLIAFFIYYFKR